MQQLFQAIIKKNPFDEIDKSFIKQKTVHSKISFGMFPIHKRIQKM
jgi:hypothetical protein